MPLEEHGYRFYPRRGWLVSGLRGVTPNCWLCGHSLPPGRAADLLDQAGSANYAYRGSYDISL